MSDLRARARELANSSADKWKNGTHNDTAAPLAEQRGDELAEMEQRKDAAYLERNQVVAALSKCYPAGRKKTAIEGWSEDWHGCVYIDLPTGQASWHYHDSHAYLFEHLPEYKGEWDGHDTPEKYRRLASTPAVQLRADGVQEVDESLSALKRLVELKEIKEQLESGDLDSVEQLSLQMYYDRNKEEAWMQGRQAIAAAEYAPASPAAAKEKNDGM